MRYKLKDRQTTDDNRTTCQCNFYNQNTVAAFLLTLIVLYFCIF